MDRLFVTADTTGNNIAYGLLSLPKYTSTIELQRYVMVDIAGQQFAITFSSSPSLL